MTERRYGFRFNVVEAGVLVVSVVFASVLIFLSGVYVGKGVEAHRTVEQRDALRMPIMLANEPRASVATPPLDWKLPKDKPTESQPSHPSVEAEGDRPPASLDTQPLAVPTRVPARKIPAASTLAQDRRETGEKKGQAKTEESPTLTTKEKPRPVKEPSPAKIEERSTALTRETPRLVKEPPAVAREKTRTKTEEGHEPPVRTAAVQSRPNEKLNEPKPLAAVPAQKPTSGAKKWKVQVEATSREETAREIAQSLRAQGYAPTVSKVQKEGAVLYRVRVGKFSTREEAVAAIGRFRRDGKFSQVYPVSE
ncbi:MAG: SPOR domain-containing protein [Deltaproteobacteria bacterium]|nr:SPOR domain-containing protein [Deltaproteobacteria bacterium]